MTTRIYAVTSADPDTLALVRATSQAQAVRHVTADYRAKVATQDQLVRLLQGGMKVEDATADAPYEYEDDEAQE